MFKKKNKENVTEEEETKELTDSETENKTSSSQSSSQAPINIVIQNNPDGKKSADKKHRKDIFYRTVLVVLVLGSFVLAGFSIYESIADSKDASESAESYLTLTGKNVNESKQIYAEFGTNKKKALNDVSLVGSKLFLSESKITPSLISGGNTTAFAGEGTDFYLYNVTQNISLDASAKSYFTDGEYYIDLDKVPEGDYLVYSDTTTSTQPSDFNPYSLNSEEALYLTGYTLPDATTGVRMRITVRNNSQSPFLLIKLTRCGTTLPSGHYDAVLFDAEYSETDGTFQKNETDDSDKHLENLVDSISSDGKYQIKVASSLEEAMSVNATLSFALSSSISEDYTSVYIPTDGYSTNVLDSTSTLAGYDANPEIRELTGYLDRASEANYGVVGNDTTKVDTTFSGKESYLIQYTTSGLSDKLTALLNR